MQPCSGTFNDDNCDFISDIISISSISISIRIITNIFPIITNNRLPGMFEGCVEVLLTGCKVFDNSFVICVRNQGKVTAKNRNKEMAK